jgi:Ala-tRNA(Pro) deacylase
MITECHDFKGVTPAQDALFAIFAQHNIPVKTYSHPAIFTVEEGIALNLPALIEGQHGKSLFLKAEDGTLWLVVAQEDGRVDLKSLAKTLHIKRFSFSKPEIMVEILGVTPGSATPFALLNDTNRQVRLVFDERFLSAEWCVFHPLDNRYSSAIRTTDLLKLFALWGYAPEIISVI